MTLLSLFGSLSATLMRSVGSEQPLAICNKTSRAGKFIEDSSKMFSLFSAQGCAQRLSSTTENLGLALDPTAACLLC